jgi:hypothetical protein
MELTFMSGFNFGLGLFVAFALAYMVVLLVAVLLEAMK